MVRRSLTISSDVDTAIQHYRSDYMQKNLPKDKDYTTAVNELLREILTQKEFLPLKE